jgi:hypothetical protein
VYRCPVGRLQPTGFLDPVPRERLPVPEVQFNATLAATPQTGGLTTRIFTVGSGWDWGH